MVSGAGFLLLLPRASTSGADPFGDSAILRFTGIFGVLVTLGLLLYEERGIHNCIKLTTVGQKIETEMGVHGRFRSRAKSVGRIINEPVASGIIYSSVLAAWVFLAIASTSTFWGVVGAGASGCTSLVLTRAFYWWVTLSEEAARADQPQTKNWWSHMYKKARSKKSNTPT